MNTLSLDTAGRNIGWSIFDKNRQLLAVGVIKTKKPTVKKQTTRAEVVNFNYVCGQLSALLANWGIRTVFSELPTGSKSSEALGLMRFATGVVLGVCNAYKIEVKWFLQSEAKKWVIGDTKASKKTVIAWAKNNYPDFKFPIFVGEMEHVADSIAIYHTAMRIR